MKFFNTPSFAARFMGMLEGMGLTSTRTDSADGRLDAGEVAYVLKALEYVFTETYDKEYPELLAITLLPVNTRVPSGAESYSYYQWDKTGTAMFITNYATDFPAAEVNLKRFNAPIHGIGNSYQYTIQDIRAAQAVQFGQGASLDTMKAEAARFVHAVFVDQVAAFGDSARGIKGFVNHSDIPDVTPISGAWTTTLATISDANNFAIVNDLNKLVNAAEQATLGLHKPDTLILPLSVKTRVMAPTSSFDRAPLLKTWLANQENIKSVFFWAKCDAANSGGKLTAGVARAIAYKRNPRILEYVLPQPFEQFPPQQIGLAFKVPCHSRTGGVSIRYPLACQRMNVGT